MKLNAFYKSLILCISALVFYAAFRSLNFSALLWDLDVYLRAVVDYFEGGDPYRENVGLLFIYHPYVLITLAGINKILPLKAILIFFFISSTLFFGAQLFSYISKEIGPKKSLWRSALWLLLPAVGFGGAGIVSFKTGNITLFLHFFVLGVFLYRVKNENKKMHLMFSFIILLAAIVKPYYLTYLILLPYILDLRKAVVVAILVIVSFSTIWLSASLVTPVLYEQFSTALTHQTLGKGDLGYAVFGLVRPYTGGSIGIIFHIFVMLAALTLLLIVLKRKGYSPQSKQVIPLAIIFLIFLNPRMKEYDFCIAILFSYTYLFTYFNSAYLKAVLLSWSIATVPLLAAGFAKLGLIEPFKLLSLPYHFQVLGFIFLAMFIARSIVLQSQEPHG